MMAFFLLLWLLNATTEEQRKGIADYFSPNLVSNSESGADGVLGGRTIMTDGAMRSDSAPPNLSVDIPQFGEEVAQEFGPEELSEEAARLLAEQAEAPIRKAELALRQGIRDHTQRTHLHENRDLDRPRTGSSIQ